jgi:hypothetical protein
MVARAGAPAVGILRGYRRRHRGAVGWRVTPSIVLISEPEQEREPEHEREPEQEREQEQEREPEQDGACQRF